MTAPSSSVERNRRVLIIDDNPLIHQDFRKILAGPTDVPAGFDELEAEIFGASPPRERPQGFEIDVVCHGEEGVALLRKAVAAGRPYALAFVDVRMPPGWDGIETTGHLWEIDPDIQIVICTAYSDYSWQETMDCLGRTDRLLILKKPFDAVEVQQLAHALTEKWSLRQETRALLEEVRRRNRDLRLVLDHVEQGLLRLDRDGIMLPERSAVVDAWLGPYGDGQTFWECALKHDPQAAAMFKLSFRMLCQGDLPVEVGLEQMPRHLRMSGRTLALSYRPIRADGGEAIEQVLMVLSDITAKLEHEQLEAEQRDLLHAFEMLIANRDAFVDFLADGDRLVQRLAAGSPLPAEEERRTLHTLKGNCGLFGLDEMARLCHEIEDRMSPPGTPLSQASQISGDERWRLACLWGRVATRLGLLASAGADQKIAISLAEHRDILRLVAADTPHAELALVIDSWRLQPVEGRLRVLADLARDLGQRLGKGAIRTTVESNGLRVDRARWAGFFGALVHVVRNAVDHGLEERLERQACGKLAVAAVGLRAALCEGQFVLEVRDDGRGIPWQRLGALARARGLPAETREDLVEALCSDGVSTQEVATEISGRGVGMGAVREECRLLGGRIQVHSEAGQGTLLQFWFPVSAMGAAA